MSKASQVENMLVEGLSADRSTLPMLRCHSVTSACHELFGGGRARVAIVRHSKHDDVTVNLAAVHKSTIIALRNTLITAPST